MKYEIVDNFRASEDPIVQELERDPINYNSSLNQVIYAGQGRVIWLQNGRRPPDSAPGWMWRSIDTQVRKNGQIWVKWEEIPAETVISPYPVMPWPGRRRRLRPPRPGGRRRRPRGRRGGMSGYAYSDLSLGASAPSDLTLGAAEKQEVIKGLGALSLVTQAAVAREIKNDATMLPYIKELLGHGNPKRAVHIAVRQALVNKLDPRKYPATAGRWLLLRKAFRGTLNKMALKRMVGMGQGPPGEATYMTSDLTLGEYASSDLTLGQNYGAYAPSELTMGEVPGDPSIMTRRGRIAPMREHPRYRGVDSDLTLGASAGDTTMMTESDLTLGISVPSVNIPTLTKSDVVKAEAEAKVQSILQKAEEEKKTEDGKSFWDEIGGVAKSLFEVGKPILMDAIKRNTETEAQKEARRKARAEEASTGLRPSNYQVQQQVQQQTNAATAQQLNKMRQAEVADQYTEQKQMQKEGISKTTMVIAGATVAAAAIPVVAKKF